MTEESTTQAEMQPVEAAGGEQPTQEQPLPPPDATLEIRFDHATNNMAVHFHYGSDQSHPANHFAAWLQRNLDAVSAMAAREFNAVREAVAFVRLPVFEQGQPEPEKPAIVESATPRLVSPHGGPLQ